MDHGIGIQGAAEPTHLRLTIAICTHNRAADARVCLEHLHPQIDFAEAALLLIDSASSPEEARALDRCLEGRPEIRLIRLAEPGLSRARNAALAAARSEWLAFIDDDAIPDHDWYAQAMRLVAVAPKDCAILGGNVSPVFPPGFRPRLGRRWRQFLSLAEQPDESFTSAGVSLCGANAAYRRSFLLECGGFPESLGRVGTKLLSGEEKLIQEIAILGGRKIARSRRLRVGHRIQPDRLQRRWVVERAYWDGRSDERIRAILGQRRTGLAVLDLLGRLVVLGALYPVSPTRQEFFLRFWYTFGRLRECLGRAAASGEAAAGAGAAQRPAASETTTA